MRPTWHFSSSKCPPDISQLHITVPCPVSGCPLERDHAAGRWLLPHLGHQGVGSEPGSLVFLLQPSAQPGLSPSQALVLCSAQTLKPLCFFHSVRDATHWMSLVLRCFFFFTYEHLWNLYAPYNWWRIIDQLDVLSSPVQKIIVCHTIVKCQPVLKHVFATLELTALWFISCSFFFFYLIITPIFFYS